MKVLVTGAGGYLGQGIVKHLLDHGHEVVAASFDKKGIDPRAEIICCDLFEIEDPYETFGKPDVLLHLAWRDGFVHYSDSHIEDLPKHNAFIKKMAQSDIHTVAVMGSMHEIGFFEGSIHEETPCAPTTPYGISKNALRQLTQLYCQQNGKNFQWLRGYYIVGGTALGSSIFSKISQAVAEGKTGFPFTTGQNQFDFLDYDDFCEMAACAVSQDEINGVINLCSGAPEKLADRVERYIKENDYPIELLYGQFPDRPYDSKAIWGDSRKIDQIMANRSEKAIQE